METKLTGITLYVVIFALCCVCVALVGVTLIMVTDTLDLLPFLCGCR